MDSDTHDGMRNVEQAAKFLGLSPASVRRLERNGQLGSVRYLNRVMFRPQDLEQFIEDHLEVA